MNSWSNLEKKMQNPANPVQSDTISRTLRTTDFFYQNEIELVSKNGLLLNVWSLTCVLRVTNKTKKTSLPEYTKNL